MQVLFRWLLANIVFSFLGVYAGTSITPYKYTDTKSRPNYTIPSDSRFTVPRVCQPSPDIIYYLTVPQEESYPIAIVCDGSTNDKNIGSVIHLHRYFLQEFQELGSAVLTLEQWGIDGNNINKKEFVDHYTVSQRLYDHIAVIEHLKLKPPLGWNGKLIFLGVSEGGPLVTTLTAVYSEMTVATMNWCGAADWKWNDQLWSFLKDAWRTAPWWVKLLSRMPRCMPGSFDVPKTKKELNARLNEAIKNPSTTEKFMGMTYKYHADVLQYVLPEYTKLKTPFLVVAGTKDSIVESVDIFVEKASDAKVPITYFRIEGMDHYVRKRPEVVQRAFQWLKQQLKD
jgi:pimeloyl-ACP methyl ester carboxylesterase